jgi:pyridinium-3,5-biscarboxylic acid mononucleotide sulfurtransferase
LDENRSMKTDANTLFAKQNRLIEKFSEYGSCAVAFSGGVDSAVAAKAAQLALGDAVVVVTGRSDALANGELEQARALAVLIGVRHVVVDTEELADSSYVANGPDRCYHCKTNLYDKLRDVADELGVTVLVNGANMDDLSDYRPGMLAAAQNGVVSPLAECGLTKVEVRELAASWNLPVASKPATPCLSSRIAYGQKVSPERLLMIDQAEHFLRALGFGELRVRYHGDDLARIEVSTSEINELCETAMRESILKEFNRLGFKFVTLDLAGFRSGSFQQLVPAESLRQFAR